MSNIHKQGGGTIQDKIYTVESLFNKKLCTYKRGDFWLSLFRRSANWTFKTRQLFYSVAFRIYYRRLLISFFKERRRRELKELREKERKIQEKEEKKLRRAVVRKNRSTIRKLKKKYFIYVDGERYYTLAYVKKYFKLHCFNQNKFWVLFFKEIKPVYKLKNITRKWLISTRQLKLLKHYYRKYKSRQFKTEDLIKQLKFNWDLEEVIDV